MGKFKEIEIEVEDEVQAKQLRLFEPESAHSRGGLVKLDVTALSHYLEMLRVQRGLAMKFTFKERCAKCQL